jgi:phenylpropionate dioxygenase-like ring-hydroxylating dioxygenase large terminal subunit
MSVSSSIWSVPDYTKIPYPLYHDAKIYADEQERIFRGPVWTTVGLEAEYPNRGDYRTTYLGDTPIVVARDANGEINAFVNRCAHRGAAVVREPYGNAKMFTCIYHQWCYGQKGELKGVPFRRGLKGVGGMPADFEMQDHGLRRLRVATYRGIIFATFSDEVEPLEDYLGPMICKHLDEVLNRPLKVLGYQRQRVYANWKLYLENIRDAYHGSLLHEFLRVFGLSRLTQVAGGHMDERHRHSGL